MTVTGKNYFKIVIKAKNDEFIEKDAIVEDFEKASFPENWSKSFEDELDASVEDFENAIKRIK